MRLPKLLLTAAAAGLAAFAAAAQNQPAEEPKAEPPAEERQGLSDLEQTVSGLQDETPAEPQPETPPAAEAPAEPAATETSAPATPAPRTDAPSTPAPPLTRAQLAALGQTVERGRLLISIARAGLIATQDMLGRVSDPEGAGIKGWIAEPEGNAMAVTFYGDGAEGPVAIFRARVGGTRVISREVFLGANRPALNPVQARMAGARAASENAEQRPCTSQPFNVLVVPPASASAPVEVYRISAPAERGRFPLGGHFKTIVAADGSVGETRGFTNACVDVAAAPVAAGQQPQPLAVTHLLDPMPTEIHMFLAQITGHPLMVVTGEPQRVWLVTNERIVELRDQAEASARN